jgi:hypothetical protein
VVLVVVPVFVLVMALFVVVMAGSDLLLLLQTFL